MKITYDASGKCFIVVGGNSGIGQSLVQIIIESGGEVVSIDIQESNENIASKRIQYFQADPRNIEELREITSELNGKDNICGLANLSGAIKYFGEVEVASDEDWDETFDISLKSCLNSCRSFAPILKRSNSSAIVNMSSGLAFIGQNNYGPYSAAKAAVVSLTLTLAKELAPEIRVNCIAPGAVDTPFIYKPDGSTRFDLQKYSQNVPTGGIAHPSEIANVIIFLLSEGASHINGACIHVNGGI